MNEQTLFALLPFVVLGVGTAVTMLASAYGARHFVTAVLASATLVAAFFAVLVVLGGNVREGTALLVMDDYALFYTGLILLATLAVVLLAYGYLVRWEGDHGAFFILLLLAALGASALAASRHFASFFLSLEVLSVSLYALIAFRYERDFAIEAGVKYLILAGASSAFLLFGMAMVYADTGTMLLPELVRMLGGGAGGLALLGFAVMIVGVGFKLAVVPFHLWTPDVYEGAPAPVTAFVATVSKGGVFAVVLRFFGQLSIQGQESLFIAFAVIALASMYAGNLLALLQTNVKRLLAYSSISHLGYMLVAFLASGEQGAAAGTFYVVAYMITTLGTFGVVSALSGGERDADAFEDYRSLFWRRPWLALIFTAMLLSLAGLPLTAGFVGKFFVATAAIGMAGGGLVAVLLWTLVVSLVVTSVIGLFYYLRLAAVMYARPAADLPPASLATPPTAAWVALGVLTVLLFAVGIYPAPLLSLIQAAVTGLV